MPPLQVGVFPANYVAIEDTLPSPSSYPPIIEFADIHLDEIIGVGGFGKVRTPPEMSESPKIIILFGCQSG